MKTKLKARYIVGYDTQLADHVIYEDAELVYQDDRVLYIGYDYPQPVDRELDFGLSMISPGFVDLNALADIDTTVIDFDARGNESCTLGKQWSRDYLEKGSHDLLNGKEEGHKNYYALLQLISRGTTTALPVTSLLFRRWAETRAEFENLAHMAAKLGLRTYLGPSYRSGVNIVNTDGTMETYWNEEEGAKGLEDNVSFIRDFDGAYNGLIHGALIPSTIETCSTKLLEATQRYAQELKVPVRLHATQGYREFCLMQERYGRTPIGHMHDLGLLNRQLLLPHAIYLNGYSGADCGQGNDWELLKNSGSTVLHCPFVLARSGTAIESYQRLLDNGIRVAVATDCYPSDMVLNMYMGSVMCRFSERNAGSASLADLYRSSTIAGADALGRPDLGRLCPGAKADITVFDLDSFHMGQIDDPIRTLILNGRGYDATDVFIDGKDVMRNRQIEGVDFSSQHHWSQTYFTAMKESFTERDYRHRAFEAFFPPAFKRVTSKSSI